MNGKTERIIGAESRIGVQDRADVAVIDIVGVIGRPEQLDGGDEEQGTTYARFAETLDRIRAIAAPEVVVNIRSTGGDVHDALLIYEALKALDARIVTRCYGYTASAATLIAQAASAGCREISAHALYLIHCSESAAEGNARSLSAVKELLDRTDERLAALYAERSGLPADRFVALMNENDGRGRWLTAEETVAAGLADRVIAGDVTGRAPVDEALVELCRVLGMTPPPTEEGGRWRRWRERLSRWLVGDRMQNAGGRGSRGAGGSGGSVRPTDGLAADAEAVVAALRAAQQAACRTEVVAGEDPSPEDGPALSPNEIAYRQDAMSMRDRLGVE